MCSERAGYHYFTICPVAAFYFFITSFVLKYKGFHNKYDYIGVVAEENCI